MSHLYLPTENTDTSHSPWSTIAQISDPVTRRMM